ncbi:MAG: peptide chain release factor N(5)-glutamine methyltransferase [Selenomonadaceae bacterium]|nr:peptide chain release factor N(5)-glutamine methyltransferase [Selenomonadaceae bacterium]MBP3722864.1 peptide chain release factor N(5)-glutamine methyltransferase [Selenomonadaceae bacterium]
MNTLKDLLNYAFETLQSANTVNPRLEAEALLSGFLRKDKLYLITHSDELIKENDAKLFKDALNRRKAGEPLAYILGKKEFYGKEFFVNKSVLIPRPETELLIDLIKEHTNDEIKILDLCAGSGCIGLTLGSELPLSKVTLSDVSKDALAVIKKNALILGLENKVKLIVSDLFQNISEKFNVIVSNPPYIPSRDILGLETSVRDYEPKLALDGGADGLMFYKKIIPTAKKFLLPKGKIFFEIGFDEADAVKAILSENNFSDIKVYKDLAELDRVVMGTFQ